MRLATPTGNYERTTGRRRRQLAAMPTVTSELRQAANRVFNRIQAKAHLPAFTGFTPMVGWRMIFDWPNLNTVCLHVEN